MKFTLATTALAFALTWGVMAHAAVLDQAPVTQVQVDGQNLLADRNQMTAYVFDEDAPGTSVCYDACAKAWPPILLEPTEAVKAPFGVTERKDGTRQITFQNSPIYLYVGDGAPGETNGDGLGGVWHIIPVPQ